MTPVRSLVDFSADFERQFLKGLREYIGAVADALGAGWESCTLDSDEPVAAYVALDWRLARFPGRDVALLWDECHGWAAAVESSCGEDVIVLAYLGGDELLPDPRAVVRFVAALRADDHADGGTHPPHLRRAGNHQELLDKLTLMAS